jgi:hypothetical protein
MTMYETTATSALLVWPPNPLLRRHLPEFSKVSAFHLERTSMPGPLAVPPTGSAIVTQDIVDSLPVLQYQLQTPVKMEMLEYQVCN